MKPFSHILVAGVVTLAITAAASAQTPAGAQNRLEVQRLVSTGSPESHAALASHFGVLADRYAAEAARHTSMAQTLAGNPNRRSADASTHCEYLTRVNAQSAATTRELAAHHDRLASGVPSTAPEDAARFERGEGAPDLSARDLAALEAVASSPADHWALEEHFLALARREIAVANAHVASVYAFQGTRTTWAAAHHNRLVQSSRDAAKAFEAAAARHAELAGIVL